MQYYTPNNYMYVLTDAIERESFTSGRKVKYLNAPIAFDIETTSTYVDGVKTAMMYVWQFAFRDIIVIGRTWEEFQQLVKFLTDTLHLSSTRRLIIWVHNLGYEFQFFRRLFVWEKVFALKERTPVYALATGGIEFRCSYVLTGYPLKKLGEQCGVPKLVGDLDYNVIRHSKTPLSDEELNYCINDVKILTHYIGKQIVKENGIHNIPLTKTGYVRRYCRQKTLYDDKSYRRIIQTLRIGSCEEFSMLMRSFTGGFTHANANHVGTVLTNVASYDFTSSYPAVMIAEKYPMSQGVCVQNIRNRKTFDTYLNRYCCIFDIEFSELFSSCPQEHYISYSRRIDGEKIVQENGRIVCAKKLVVTITNIDFDIIRQTYIWGDIRVGRMYCYKKDYLPTSFVQSILDLYKIKTEYKGVQGMEQEYMCAKEMLNSCYGMCVTSPLRPIISYTTNWDIKPAPASNEEIDKINKSPKRFLFYPWGVFVTAYARRNLWSAILALKNDYVYSDTDSVKFLECDTHMSYFKAYNGVMEQKLIKACEHHSIDPAEVSPYTVNGVKKTLGLWDFEGVYSKFKTLGAKRYMVEKNGKIDITVSGVCKQVAIPYLVSTYGRSGVFNAFDNLLSIPPLDGGKKLRTYIDYEQRGEIRDYVGNVGNYSELSSMHLENTGYTLNLSIIYLDYLCGKKPIMSD